MSGVVSRHLSSMLLCPFCQPSASDVLLLESDRILVLCDAKPITVGHLLITSRSHVPSVFDLQIEEYVQVRSVARKVVDVVRQSFGEVGVYEHGRSAICRFGMVDAGHTHAHLHILPLSFDLIGNIGSGTRSRTPPAALSLNGADRYLYQEVGDGATEVWSVAHSGEVPRHFVRLAAQNELKRRGLGWLPIDTDPNDHEEAVLLTQARLGAALSECK
jgi:histidine triad (HIT) family protein